MSQSSLMLLRILHHTTIGAQALQLTVAGVQCRLGRHNMRNLLGSEQKSEREVMR